MVEIDPITGLPKELGVWENISLENQKITASIEKRKFGKKYTIVKGFGPEISLNDIGKKLKSKFACGGSSKNGQVELQGDHLSRIKDALMELGFAQESIEIR
ncbi:stress response translation initiation inhibitor YciH [archaeon]|nr:stress response translation initiation inhibitor YciH [archaeon]|tara:strand:- start:1917 stop:2222 length:306 start_codon:yes stop_codon:yes gene_type:complete